MNLTRNVLVGRTWYGPAYGNAENVPADVAKRITSRAARGNDRADAGEGGEAPREPAAPAPASPSGGPGPQLPRPKGNASEEAWRAYRVSQGVVTAEEAEAMSRDELRDLDEA